MSQAAEKAILGAMLQSPVAVADAMATLRSDDFVLKSHREVFGAMLPMHERGEDINLITLAAAMGGSTGTRVQGVGGMGFLADLTTDIPHLNISSYVRIVLDRALAIRAAHACSRAISKLEDPSEDPRAIVDSLVSELDDARPEQSMHISEVLKTSLDFLDGAVPERFSTGIAELDDLTAGGVRPQELWVIGGLSSSGKSALVRQIERALMPYGVHSHSLEVGREKWANFHAADFAGVEPWKLRTPEFMSSAEKQRMRDAQVRLAGCRHFIEDPGTATLQSMLAKSRLSVLRHGVRIHTVDYLQQMHGKEQNRHHQIGTIVRGLKAFAHDTNSAVILLSQLNEDRDGRRGNHRPKLSDLRESGDIRQAADVIVFTYRDGPEHKPTNQDQLVVAKQRDGKLGIIYVTLDTKTLTFIPRQATDEELLREGE